MGESDPDAMLASMPVSLLREWMAYDLCSVEDEEDAALAAKSGSNLQVVKGKL